MSAEPAKPNDIIQILSLLMKYIQNKLTIYYPYFKKHEQFKYGGAMRDRTADLFAASEALSQLSYSPDGIINPIKKLINGLIFSNLFIKIPIQQVDLVLVESEAHSKQPPLNCQPLF